MLQVDSPGLCILGRSVDYTPRIECGEHESGNNAELNEQLWASPGLISYISEVNLLV